jgi:hypothetical protein
MREAILRAISDERERRDAKWGEQNHDDPDWALILGEEFGEVQKAVLESRMTYGGESMAADAEIDKEITQLIAVGVAWIEARHRRRERA